MEDGYALPSRTMRNANVQYIGGATLIVVYNVSPFSTMLSDLESSAIIAAFFFSSIISLQNFVKALSHATHLVYAFWSSGCKPTVYLS